MATPTNNGATRAASSDRDIAPASKMTQDESTFSGTKQRIPNLVVSSSEG